MTNEEANRIVVHELIKKEDKKIMDWLDRMTREEAYKFLMGISYAFGNTSIEYLTEKDGEKMRKAIEILQQEPWIPVSEDTPKECETVIASTKYGVYPEARYTKEYGWEWAYESGADYWRELEDVEAWMPLPERYNAERGRIRNEWRKL